MVWPGGAMLGSAMCGWVMRGEGICATVCGGSTPSAQVTAGLSRVGHGTAVLGPARFGWASWGLATRGKDIHAKASRRFDSVGVNQGEAGHGVLGQGAVWSGEARIPTQQRRRRCNSVGVGHGLARQGGAGRGTARRGYPRVGVSGGSTPSTRARSGQRGRLRSGRAGPGAAQQGAF